MIHVSINIVIDLTIKKYDAIKHLTGLQIHKLSYSPSLNLELVYIIFLHLTKIIKFRMLQTTMNNQSINTASPKRIIKVLINVITNRLAHPVKGIMTFWM